MAFVYAEVLARVVLQATTSSIARAALLGNNTYDHTELDRRTNVLACPMRSAGLLDLIYFKAADESYDGGERNCGVTLFMKHAAFCIRTVEFYFFLSLP